MPITRYHDSLLAAYDLAAADVDKIVREYLSRLDWDSWSPQDCFAKKFAAKEAFSKALGTGISGGISFNEIVILNTKSGKPFIKLLGKTKKIVNNIFKGKKFNISLSLSDDIPFALAAVIISI